MNNNGDRAGDWKEIMWARALSPANTEVFNTSKREKNTIYRAIKLTCPQCPQD